MEISLSYPRLKWVQFVFLCSTLFIKIIYFYPHWRVWAKAKIKYENQNLLWHVACHITTSNADKLIPNPFAAKFRSFAKAIVGFYLHIFGKSCKTFKAKTDYTHEYASLHTTIFERVSVVGTKYAFQMWSVYYIHTFAVSTLAILFSKNLSF